MAGTAGRGRLRASHADREHVIDTLKPAFVQGRLSKDEFDMRVGQALVSRTYSELARLTADIPAGLMGAQPLRKPARAQARRPVNNGAKSGAWALIAAAALVASLSSLSSGDGALFFFVAVSVFMSLLGSRGQMLDSRHEKRSCGLASHRGR